MESNDAMRWCGSSAHPDVAVDLLLQVADLGHVLADSLLQVQDAAALLLRVAGDLQLETHALLLLTVLLRHSTRATLALATPETSTHAHIS